MVSRREFLKSAGGFTLAAPFLIGRNLRLSRPSCVIIGAGLSGLAAAYALKKEQWDVTIIEARDRTGGRVYTHTMKENASLTCELGAEWVGASHERIRKLCEEFGLPLLDHRFAITLMRNGVVQPPGRWKYSPQAEAAFEKLKAEYKKYGVADKKKMDQYDWWTLLEERGFTQDDLRLRDLFDSTDFGESIRQVSAYVAATEYFESSPENEMDFKIEGGNSRLVDALVARIGVESIHLGKPAQEVRQKGGRVFVKAGGEEFTADACICTVPSRVLGGIRFDPPLPARQAQAAEELQYARITKNSVLYGERFWGAENFSLVSDVTSHYYFHSTKNQPGKEGILTSYAIGEKADVLAAQDEERRLRILTGDLIPLNERAPGLAKGLASYAWQRDPLVGGAYAIYRPGQWFGVRDVLARPHGKVLFAGEHLADWQGFMEGAIETGEAAAKALAR
ncbi:MAG: Amine oxidase [Chlorobi bacterium]|nr:Amine oxidase [Chlorobiota bacterium]